MSCGVGHRCNSDPVLLWCRLAATAQIRPLHMLWVSLGTSTCCGFGPPKTKQNKTKQTLNFRLEDKDKGNLQKVKEEGKQSKNRRKKDKKTRGQVQGIEHLNNRRAEREKRENQII